jgi:yeast amino acid transporter
LAIVGNAPKIFAKTSKSGLPYVSVIFCSLFALLAFMALSKGAGTVFNWFSNMISVAGLMTWFGICVTYIRFYSGTKAQGINRRSLPYYFRFQPFAAWYGAVWIFFICLVWFSCSFLT